MSHGNIKFVAMDPDRGGLPMKRKQTQNACTTCRRKKRRCGHNDDDTPHIQAAASSPPMTMATAPTASPVLPDMDVVYSPPETRAKPRKSIGALSARFVGDSNPEGMFLEATGSAGDPGRHGPSKQGDVGIWLASPDKAAVAPDKPSQFITSRPPPLMDRFLLPFVKEYCLTCLPPEADLVKLRAVYKQKIHPIFPIVPLAAMDDPGPIGRNPASVILQQLICLAAGTDPEMGPHLRLPRHGQPEDTHLLSPQEFSRTLSSSVRTTLDTSIVTDRVLHIRALTMLSLYTQPSTAEETDLPAQLGGRAIHHVQTLGLHILRYEGPHHEELENLFCAVWAIDRINSAIYGIPCLIHERDIGADLQASFRRRPPCFRLLLLIVQWLDHVIGLYRPGPSEQATFKKINYIDLPVLEGMIVEAEALTVPSPLIGT